MKQTRILFVSTYPPRACGIGTFTRDLITHMKREIGWVRPEIAAVDIEGEEDIQYGDQVVRRIMNCRPNAYAELAEAVNRSHYDAVCVQHEFGIFPGEWGIDVTDLYTNCKKPLVTTLHTVIPKCPVLPRRIIRTIMRHSRATVVMAKVGLDILRNNYNVPSANLKVVPHGVPISRRMSRPVAKRSLGFHCNDLILTFGLLSRGKGVEYMIGAMPQVLKDHPNAVYCILGQTHPVVKKNEGESYRQELQRMVEDLNLQQHVRFVGRFLSDEELSVFLQAADVYVAPYVGADQITSGALARAVFFGKAIVSTPFLYAGELLADDRGRLVPFSNSDALGRAVSAILADQNLQASMEARMRQYGRRMSWEAVVHRYARVFREVIASGRPQSPLVRQMDLALRPRWLPQISSTAHPDDGVEYQL